MSRQVKIVIFSIILIASYFIKQENNFETKKSENNYSPDLYNNSPSSSDMFDDEINVDDLEIEPISNNDDVTIKYFPIPVNGFSPYDIYVGKGIYDNNSGNEFEIKNSNSTHAIVLLVDAYSGKKIRNEFIRKGTDFLMTGVPDGTYYLQWFSGDDWSPELKIGGFIGGFQSKQGFTKTRDMSDWMKVDGYAKWTVTLYAVEGGDVESESINPDEFLN